MSGAKRDGAYYWSGERSKRRPGSCSPQGQTLGDWTVGCLEAQQRLAYSDLRRHSDPQYWFGWNAYSGSSQPPTASGSSAPPAAATAPAPTLDSSLPPPSFGTDLFTPPTRTPAPAAPSEPETEASSSKIVLHSDQGRLTVPVLINNQLTLNFVIDSGASDVSIPADIVLTLMRTGTLTLADFLGGLTYVLADGSTIPSAAFRIRSLKVGDITLTNVTGSLAPVEGGLLLGQNFSAASSRGQLTIERKYYSW